MAIRSGASCPVIVAEFADWERDYEDVSLGDLLALTDEQLAAVDPLAMNLVVAKGLPAFAGLRISHYQATLNDWVRDFSDRCLQAWEPYFQQAPQQFRNDIQFFRLGMMCQYLELEIGVAYNQGQREARSVLYTDPSDLFLNGVLDTRLGTCGNLAALHVAFAWRLGWPVSLACVNSHFVCRFDDGRVTYNIEATQCGRGGFKSDPDEYLITEKKLAPFAIISGSDLRALRPREMLGQFVGLRARHVRDVGTQDRDESKILASEPDWLLARMLCPSNRQLYRSQVVVTTMRGNTLFDAGEAAHPRTYAGCLEEIEMVGQCRRIPTRPVSPQSTPSAEVADKLFF